MLLQQCDHRHMPSILGDLQGRVSGSISNSMICAVAEEEFDELREIARGVDSLVTRDRLDENSGVTIGGINGKALAPVPDALDDDDEQLVEEWREIAQMREDASTEDTRSQL